MNGTSEVKVVNAESKCICTVCACTRSGPGNLFLYVLASLTYSCNSNWKLINTWIATSGGLFVLTEGL